MGLQTQLDQVKLDAERITRERMEVNKESLALQLKSKPVEITQPKPEMPAVVKPKATPKEPPVKAAKPMEKKRFRLFKKKG